MAGGIRMGNHQQVVFAVVLNHPATLQETFLLSLTLEQLPVGALDDIRKIGLQLHQFTCAIDHIDASVIVKEQRAVMEMAHTRYQCPGT